MKKYRSGCLMQSDRYFVIDIFLSFYPDYSTVTVIVSDFTLLPLPSVMTQ